MTLGADATNWINIRAIDLNAPAATIPLPVMTGTFALNIYNQTTRLPISGVGGVNTTINMFNCTESVRVYSTFAGNLNWNGQAFDYVVNGLITSAAQLNALMTYIADTTQDGYWLLSGFSYSPITCTGASGTGSIATISFPAQSSAPFAIGSSITVSGFTPSGYNGTYIVTNCTTTSVSYANTTTGVPSVFGTVIQKSFSGGDIIGKQTAAGIATETWYARTYAQAPACAKATGGLVYFKGPGGTWSLPNSGASTTLTASVTSTSTSLPVTSTQAFPSSGAVTIDSEVIYYSSKTTTSFTGLTRGFAGTTAAAHVSGSLVLSNQDSTTQDKVIWDFSVNNWTAATVPMSGVYPSGTFTAGGLFSIAISVGTDGFTQALVTSSSSVTAGNCIVGIPKVIPDELKTSTRLPTLKALFDVNSSNLSLLGSTTDSLGFGLMCYGSTGTFIGFYSCTKSAFVLPNTTNFGDSSIDTVQLPSNVYSAAPIIYCANSITGAVSFGLKRVVLQKELFGSLPAITNQQIDQITQFGMNSILIRSNGKVYSTMGNTSIYSGFTGRSAQGYGFPQYYGIRNFSDISLPAGETSPAIDCGTGFEFNYILCANGNLYVWGHNAYGQLGLGNSNIYYTPTLSATGVVKVFYGNEQSQYQYDATRAFILKTDGYVYGCGYNGLGGLGIGNTTATINTWTQITGMGQNPISVWNLGSSYGCTFVQKSDGTIWFTGYDGYGQSGSGSTSAGRASFINVTNAWTGGNSAMRIRQATGGFGFVDSSAQSYSYVVMSLSDGSTSRVATAGSNNWGNLGDGTTTDRTTPVVPNIGSGTVQKIHVAGGGAGTVGVLKTNGDYWSWGHNGYGCVGDGTTTNRPTPALRLSGVIDLPIVNNTTPGYGWYTQMFIQKSDGLYVVGNNDSSYCGVGVQGSTITTFTKVLLPNNLSLKMLGFYSTENSGKAFLAVMNDNSLYAWGYNTRNGIVSEHTYNCPSPQLFTLGTPQYSSASYLLSSNVPTGDETIIVASSRLQGTAGVAFDFLQTLSNKTNYWSGTQYKAPRNQKVTVSGVLQRTAGDCNVWLWKNNVKYAALCGLFDVYNRAFSLSIDLTAGDVIDLRPDNNIQISGGTSAPYGSILCITPDYQNQIVQTDPTVKGQYFTRDGARGTNGILIFEVMDTKTPDTLGCYNSSNGTFTCKVNGVYSFGIKFMTGGVAAGSAGYLYSNVTSGGVTTTVAFTDSYTATSERLRFTVGGYLLSLKAGDTVTFTCNVVSTMYGDFNYFSFYRIGNL